MTPGRLFTRGFPWAIACGIVAGLAFPAHPPTATNPVSAGRSPVSAGRSPNSPAHVTATSNRTATTVERPATSLVTTDDPPSLGELVRRARARTAALQNANASCDERYNKQIDQAEAKFDEIDAREDPTAAPSAAWSQALRTFNTLVAQKDACIDQELVLQP